MKEAKGNQLLNIRNPWGAFEWGGDWSDISPLWTKEMKALIKPVLDKNDGTFWMVYQDFVTHFKSVNVCKVKNWDDVRIKGKFIRVQVNFFMKYELIFKIIKDIEDSNIEVVMSKWYYSVPFE